MTTYKQRHLIRRKLREKRKIDRIETIEDIKLFLFTVVVLYLFAEIGAYWCTGKGILNGLLQ